MNFFISCIPLIIFVCLFKILIVSINKKDNSDKKVINSLGVRFNENFTEAVRSKCAELVEKNKDIPANKKTYVIEAVFKNVHDGLITKVLIKDLIDNSILDNKKAELFAIRSTGYLTAYYQRLEAQSSSVASTYFEWSTAGDSKTCKFCKKCDGKIFSFEEGAWGRFPGECEDCKLGYCRCVMIPIIDDEPRPKNKDGSYRRKRYD